MKGVITIAYNNLEKSIETKNILVEKLNKAGFEISENIEENTELIIGTPAEIKKFATSKGNADKELMSLIFNLYFPDLVKSCLKTDDIADAFFMSNFSKSKTLDIKDEIEEKYDITKISKDAQNSKKEKKKLAKRTKSKNPELDEILESI